MQTDLLEKSKASIEHPYKDCNIPAKLFFDICISGEVEKVEDFDAIYDEYFTLKNDQRVLNLMASQKKLALLILKANVIQDVLFCLNKFANNKEFQDKVIPMLASLGVFINPKSIRESIKKQLHSKIGSLKNQIRLEELALKQYETKVTSTYEQIIVNIENVLERSLNDEMTLYKFVAYEKSAKAKIEHQKKNKKNGK